MALCVHCQKETELYHGGTPVCVDCSDARTIPSSIATRLQRDLAAATERADAAHAAFQALMRDIPSDLPQPDGTQHLQNASRELTVARQALMEATVRLNDFLNRGTIPEDLQR
jgi:hypothetical protein